MARGNPKFTKVKTTTLPHLKKGRRVVGKPRTYKQVRKVYRAV